MSFSFLNPTLMGKRKYSNSTGDNVTDVKRTRNTRTSTHGKISAQHSIATSTAEFETEDDVTSTPGSNKRRKSVTADIVDIGNGFIIISKSSLNFKVMKL